MSVLKKDELNSEEFYSFVTSRAGQHRASKLRKRRTGNQQQNVKDGSRSGKNKKLKTDGLIRTALKDAFVVSFVLIAFAILMTIYTVFSKEYESYNNLLGERYLVSIDQLGEIGIGFTALYEALSENATTTIRDVNVLEGLDRQIDYIADV